MARSRRMPQGPRVQAHRSTGQPPDTARSRRMPQGPRVQAHRSTGQPPDTARSRRTPQGPCLEGNDYAAAGLSAQGMRWTQGKGYAAGKDPFPVRETLSSACRPSFMRSFLRVIIPRARDAPICLPPVRPRLPARNFCPCAPDAPICLPPVRPARLPARNFRPCAGRSHLLAVRPARAPPCTQFSPVRRTLPSACRPFGPCAFLHAIFARARRALSPACHPLGRASLHAIFARAPDAPSACRPSGRASLHAIFSRAPDAPSACRPSGPRAFLHAIFARAPDAPICLPSARPARLPARNFRPCAGRISRPPGSSRTETAAPPRAGRSAGRKTRGMAEGLEARLKRLHTLLEN